MHSVASHVLATGLLRQHLIHGVVALAFLVVAVAAGAFADARQRRTANPQRRQSS